MKIEDMVLVSVDDHVVEPPHVFEGRLPAKYADLAPKFVTRADGTNAWVYEGQEIGNVALNAVAGRPPEEYGMEPTSFAELRAGCYDIDERVKDMDANGVLGSLCFPSFPQFCGQLFARTEDKDVALAMVRAYNDWHIEDWCGSHPGRFIPCSLPAIWDPQVLADEVRRTARMGAHAVTFSENPSKLGWPSFHSDHWDPFWRARCAARPAWARTRSPSPRTRPSWAGRASTPTTGTRSGGRAPTRTSWCACTSARRRSW